MLLNSAKIRQKGIVKNAADSSYRNASYDLRIAKIVPPTSATEERERFALPPQGIVEVISEERVTLPTNVSPTGIREMPGIKRVLRLSNSQQNRVLHR